MAGSPLQHVLHYVRHVAEVETTDELADGELLTRFVSGREEAAFAAMVRRHGAMVLGVCRRMLGDNQAEDAVQATFLVLARRAAAIRKRQSLRCWLYGVACRVARKFRRAAARRPRHEPLTDVPCPDTTAEVSWREVGQLLDEELSRLPERFRLPLLLCYLEEKTRDEAAAELGWKVSTLRGRLERGRQLLRTRLARRGVTLSAALLCSTLTPAVLSAESMTVIVRAGVAWGTATRETIAPAAAAVAEGVIRAMSMKRIAIVFGLILTLGSLGLGAAVLARPGTADEPTVSVARAVPIGPQADKDALPAALRRLIAESDGIVVAETPEPGKPEFRVKRVLKGQLLVGEPVNVNRIAGMDTLPAVNAGKEWLLFLRIVEDDLAHPEVYPVMARGWLRPASAELVRRVRDAIPPPRVWEPEQNWLRLGLALRQTRFQPGEDIVAEVWLQNLRQEEFPVLHLRYNIYDYWRDTRFEVKGPDGRKWILEKPVGKMQEADFPYTKKLQPGETYIHTIRLNRWPVSRGEIQKYAANLFVEPGTYTIQCIYEYALAKGPWWALRSAPVQWELPRALLGEGRLKDLRRNLDHSQVWVTLQPDEPPNKWNVNYELRHVSLEVPLTLREPPGIGPTGKPVSAGVRIPKEQAAQIVDVLARAGYFDRALTLLAVAPDVKGRSAEIAVNHSGTNPPTQYRLSLPWGRPMLRQLEALRACVDGEAGRLLDRLLQPLREESKKWPAAPMP